jgi:hypothetical protein
MHRIQARNLIVVTLAAMVFAEFAILKDLELAAKVVAPIVAGGVIILILFNITFNTSREEEQASDPWRKKGADDKK